MDDAIVQCKLWPLCGGCLLVGFVDVVLLAAAVSPCQA